VSDDQFQMNIDGQQITQRVAGSGFGQPKMSREAIADSGRDEHRHHQGRSTGIQVQAISRSGTNDTHGSTFGFFRSDKFNAADPVKGTVLPYQDQQAGFTLGGPIVKDKLHYFASYEYERNPLTAVLTPTALPSQSWDLPSNTVQKNYLVRADYQHSSTNTFSLRYQRWTSANPFLISSGGTHPSMAADETYYSNNTYGTWTHIINNGLMFQVRQRQQFASSTTRFRRTRQFLARRSPRCSSSLVIEPGRPAELPELHLAGQLPGPAGRELAHGQARDDSASQKDRDTSVGPESPRHICVQNTAVAGDSERGVPAGPVEQPVRVEIDALPVPAEFLQQGLPG
jgi:hypothetical protein